MKSIQSGGNPKISEATDEQLFALMAQRGEEAREAWETFYRRYINDFHRLVCRLPGVSPSDVNDLVQDTMVQAWKSAHTFQGGGDGDPDGARRWALAWLGRIARNHYWGTRRRKITLVNDAVEQEDKDENASHKDEPRSRRLSKLHHEIERAVNLVAGVTEISADAGSGYMQLLREALATLTDRERDVMLATYEHYEPGQQQQRRLPKEVVAEICSKFAITPDNLRQIRKRTDAKIRQYVTEHIPAETRS